MLTLFHFLLAFFMSLPTERIVQIITRQTVPLQIANIVSYSHNYLLTTVTLVPGIGLSCSTSRLCVCMCVCAGAGLLPGVSHTYTQVDHSDPPFHCHESELKFKPDDTCN